VVLASVPSWFLTPFYGCGHLHVTQKSVRLKLSGRDDTNPLAVSQPPHPVLVEAEDPIHHDRSNSLTKNERIKKANQRAGQYKSLYYRTKKQLKRVTQRLKDFSKGIPRFPRLEVNP